MEFDKQTQREKSGLIYALDFDGVICDSAIETSITGWKAAQNIWQDMPSPLPPKKLISDFRQIRPFLETGYEAILIMRLLQQGVSATSLCDNYKEQLEQLVHNNSLNIGNLKKLFGSIRDHWIKENLQEWLQMNPFFEGIQHALKKLDSHQWYIITTKQKRFVKHILHANNIQLKDQHIYGMERKMSKADTLLKLIKKHPYQQIIFIEDRFPTLSNINAKQQLQTIKLQLASWGYNTPIDKKNAQNLVVELININQFISE